MPPQAPLEGALERGKRLEEEVLAKIDKLLGAFFQAGDFAV